MEFVVMGLNSNKLLAAFGSGTNWFIRFTATLLKSWLGMEPVSNIPPAITGTGLPFWKTSP